MAVKKHSRPVIVLIVFLILLAGGVCAERVSAPGANGAPGITLDYILPNTGLPAPLTGGGITLEAIGGQPIIGLFSDGIIQAAYLPSLEVSGVYTYNDTADPMRYGLTYYQSFYLRSSAYADLAAIMAGINAALPAGSPYECIEIDHYDPANQGWETTAKWRNYDQQLDVYHTRPIYNSSTGNVTYEYPAASPAVDFSRGDYIYLGFGKLSAAAVTVSGNWLYRDALDARSEPKFNWAPK